LPCRQPADNLRSALWAHEEVEAASADTQGEHWVLNECDNDHESKVSGLVCPTQEQKGDTFTKALPPAAFTPACGLIGMRTIVAAARGV